MHKIKVLWISLTMILLGWSGFASADTVSNYVFDFNDQDALGQIDEARSTGYYKYFVYDFAPQGWGHIPDGIYDPSDRTTNYPSYSFEEAQGVDGSGTLAAGEQSAWSSTIQGTQQMHDLLVTPLVSGTATLAVKMRSVESWYDHHITFYKVTYSNGQYVRGEELAPDNAIDFNTTNWQTATFTLSEPTYIGIEASYAYIDNFTATSAEIAARPGLSITSVTNNSTNYDANDANNITFDYTVDVKNSGTVKLVAGQTENYSISITHGQNGKVLATVPVTKNLEVGASDTIHVVASVPFDSIGSDEFTAYILENLSQKTREASTVKAVPYAPILTLAMEGKTFASGSDIPFGTSQKTINRAFSITNDGAKELKINTFTLPEPFTSVFTVPVTIEPHHSMTFSVDLSNEAIGVHSGQLKITADELPDFTANLSGTIIDSTAWFVDFENMSRWQEHVYPKGFVVETAEGQSAPDWEIFGIESGLGLVDNTVAIQNSSVSRMTKFISPLLNFDGNETLSFDAAKRESNYDLPSNNSVLKVYYSPDRKDWHLLYTIAADESVDHDATFATEGIKGENWYSSNAYEFTHYVVSGIPAGQWYVGFEAGYAQVDNLLGGHTVDVAHDLALDVNNIPADGQVNHASQATVGIANANAKDEAEGSYTAKLFFDDTEVATAAAAPALISGQTTNIQFDYTPHHEGTFNAYVQLQFNDTTITSDTVQVTIAAESFSALKQAGDANSFTYAPIYTYDRNSEGAAIIPASTIGLPAGTEINSLVLRGVSDRDINVTSLKVYLGSTDIDAISLDDQFTLESVADTANMTRIYDGAYSIHKGGSGDSNGLNSVVDLINITLDKPFVYNGGNLVLAMKHSASNYGNIYLQGDRTNYPENAVKRSSDYTISSGSWALFPMPVVYFGYQGEAPVLSGTVTSNGAPVANVPVVISSDGVVYSDTTANDGTYSFAVLQDKVFTLSANLAGYEPYSVSDVRVNGNTTVDINLTPATGIYLESHAIPQAGEVNTQLTASATVLNDIATDIAAADYTAKFYIDGKAVSEVKAVDLASQKEATFNFAFTPHAAGAFPAYIQFTYGNNVYTTDTATINISEENFGGDIQVGDSTSTNRSSDLVPWNNYYKQFESEIIYTADQIKISKGSVINRISFPGYFMTASGGVENLRVYIENTADGAYELGTSFVPRDTTEMTKIFNDTISYGNHAPQVFYNVLSIDIPNGFVYDGKSIRISVAGSHGANDADNKVVWVVDDKYGNQAKGRRTDYGSISESSWQNISSLPVMYLTVISKKTVTGVVTNKKTNEPVANASVTLASNGVEYYGSTDAEGKYAINVAKTALTYNAIFSADSFITDTVANVVFGTTDTLTVNDTIAPQPVAISLSGVVKGIQRHAGVAVDESAAQPLAGATVAITDADDKAVATATTDETGAYTVDSLLEGTTYKVVFSADGYADSTLTFTASDTNAVANATLLSAKVKINVSGTVKGVTDSEANAQALEGATITVKDAEDNTVATATTAADGTYTISDLDEDAAYTFEFAAAGFVSQTVNVTAGAENQTVDATLWTEVALGIDGIDATNTTISGNVYTIDGKYVGRNIDRSSLRRGVYIINGKKIAVK